MLKYLLGLLKNILKNNVSIFSLVDYKSKISCKAKVNRGAKLYNSTVGSFSYIGPKSEIIFTDIAKYCSIADNCSIGLPSHSMKNISTSPIFTAKKNGTKYSWVEKNKKSEYLRTIIGNDVWIGTRVMIMGGIKIGNGAIIGAGSIVTKDIPDYAIAVGVPAIVIKTRFEKQIIEKLSEIKWWDKSEEKIKENINIFQIENFTLEDLDKV